MLITEVSSQVQEALQNDSKFNTLTIRDDGEIIIYLHNGTPNDFDDDITIFALHNYTLEVLALCSKRSQLLHRSKWFKSSSQKGLLR